MQKTTWFTYDSVFFKNLGQLKTQRAFRIFTCKYTYIKQIRYLLTRKIEISCQLYLKWQCNTYGRIKIREITDEKGATFYVSFPGIFFMSKSCGIPLFCPPTLARARSWKRFRVSMDPSLRWLYSRQEWWSSIINAYIHSRAGVLL